MALKIGISGKRNIPENEKKEVAAQIENSIRRLLADNKEAQFIGYTSLALGADTIFAEVVTKIFNRPLQIVLPFAADEYRKDFTTPADLEKLNRLLADSPNIKVQSTSVPGDPWQRNKAYFEAGKYIVDTCDEMIFVWDELKPRGNGGTAEVLGYYSEKKKSPAIPYIPVHPANEDLLHNEITDFYHTSNDRAIKSRNNYKKIWRAAIFGGWLAVILFAINTGYHLEGLAKVATVLFEFLLVVSVFVLITVAKSKDFHGKYLKERMRAETFRILKYYYHANIDVKISSFTLKEDKELSQVAQQINNTVQSENYKSKWYANYVIKTLIDDQKKYHLQKIADSGNKAHRLEKITLWIGVLFLINLFVHLVSTMLLYFPPHTELPFYSHEFATLASIVLPATYAAIEGVLYFQGWELLKKYSESAEKSLEDSVSELPKSLESMPDETSFARQSLTLNLVSSIMLTDNKNWQFILEDKANYHWVV